MWPAVWRTLVWVACMWSLTHAQHTVIVGPRMTVSYQNRPTEDLHLTSISRGASLVVHGCTYRSIVLVGTGAILGANITFVGCAMQRLQVPRELANTTLTVLNSRIATPQALSCEGEPFSLALQALAGTRITLRGVNITHDSCSTGGATVLRFISPTHVRDSAILLEQVRVHVTGAAQRRRTVLALHAARDQHVNVSLEVRDSDWRVAGRITDDRGVSFASAHGGSVVLFGLFSNVPGLLVDGSGVLHGTTVRVFDVTLDRDAASEPNEVIRIHGVADGASVAVRATLPVDVPPSAFSPAAVVPECPFGGARRETLTTLRRLPPMGLRIDRLSNATISVRNVRLTSGIVIGSLLSGTLALHVRRVFADTDEALVNVRGVSPSYGYDLVNITVHHTAALGKGVKVDSAAATVGRRQLVLVLHNVSQGFGIGRASTALHAPFGGMQSHVLVEGSCLNGTLMVPVVPHTPVVCRDNQLLRRVIAASSEVLDSTRAVLLRNIVGVVAFRPFRVAAASELHLEDTVFLPDAADGSTNAHVHAECHTCGNLTLRVVRSTLHPDVPGQAPLLFVRSVGQLHVDGYDVRARADAQVGRRTLVVVQATQRLVVRDFHDPRAAWLVHLLQADSAVVLRRVTFGSITMSTNVPEEGPERRRVELAHAALTSLSFNRIVNTSVLVTDLVFTGTVTFQMADCDAHVYRVTFNTSAVRSFTPMQLASSTNSTLAVVDARLSCPQVKPVGLSRITMVTARQLKGCTLRVHRLHVVGSDAAFRAAAESAAAEVSPRCGGFGAVTAVAYEGVVVNSTLVVTSSLLLGGASPDIGGAFHAKLIHATSTQRATATNFHARANVVETVSEGPGRSNVIVDARDETHTDPAAPIGASVVAVTDNRVRVLEIGLSPCVVFVAVAAPVLSSRTRVALAGNTVVQDRAASEVPPTPRAGCAALLRITSQRSVEGAAATTTPLTLVTNNTVVTPDDVVWRAVVVDAQPVAPSRVAVSRNTIRGTFRDGLRGTDADAVLPPRIVAPAALDASAAWVVYQCNRWNGTTAFDIPVHVTSVGCPTCSRHLSCFADNAVAARMDEATGDCRCVCDPVVSSGVDGRCIPLGHRMDDAGSELGARTRTETPVERGISATPTPLPELIATATIAEQDAAQTITPPARPPPAHSHAPTEVDRTHTPTRNIRRGVVGAASASPSNARRAYSPSQTCTSSRTVPALARFAAADADAAVPATAVTAASSAALLAAVATGGSAGDVQSLVLLGLLDCTKGSAVAATANDAGWTVYPLRVGARPDLAPLLGSVLLGVGALCMQLAVAAVVQRVKRLPDFASAAAVARCPAVSWAVWNFLLPGAATASVAVMSDPRDAIAGTVGTAVAVLVTSWLAVATVTLREARRASTAADAVAPSLVCLRYTHGTKGLAAAVRYYVAPCVFWKGTPFRRRWGPAVSSAAGWRALWFPIAALARPIAFGAVAGASFLRGECALQLGLLAAVNTTHAAVLLWCWPLRSKLACCAHAASSAALAASCASQAFAATGTVAVSITQATFAASAAAPLCSAGIYGVERFVWLRREMRTRRAAMDPMLRSEDGDAPTSMPQMHSPGPANAQTAARTRAGSGGSLDAGLLSNGSLLGDSFVSNPSVLHSSALLSLPVSEGTPSTQAGSPSQSRSSASRSPYQQSQSPSPDRPDVNTADL